MATPAPATQPTPAIIFETLNAYQRTAALKTAVELDVFTHIGEGRNDVKSLAELCSAAERGIRTLCDYLVIIGFLHKQDHRYSLTPESSLFLDRRSPACLGTVTRFLTTEQHVDSYKRLTEIVRRGGALDDANMKPDNPIWVEFAHSMVPLMMPAGQAIAEMLEPELPENAKVLDIAAGHGMFGIAVARRHPTARIVAVDWTSVLEVARDNAGKAGVMDRYSTIAGSAFDVDYGSGYDAVLLTNFLHHFDPPTCEGLLRKIHAALRPRGCVITLEFVPNDDRVSPPNSAAFSLMMLGSTPHGDAYTFTEFERMFRNSGFGANRLVPLEMSEQKVIVSRRS